MKSTIVLLLISCLAMSMEDAATPEGLRDMNEVRNVLSPLNTTISDAYKELLTTDSEASGEILISFSITPEGDVILAEATCSEGLETLHDTVLEEVNALEFPPCSEQDGDIPVTVPVRLMPPQ